MSAGNYGRAFAYASKKLGLTGNRCLMPDSAPSHRAKAIEKMGVTVDLMPSASLRAGVKLREEKGDVSICSRIPIFFCIIEFDPSIFYLRRFFYTRSMTDILSLDMVVLVKKFLRMFLMLILYLFVVGAEVY